uniref:Aldedh domain-containing protein n=1 Tax=Macrostomum lignano TaxID=282301 RepID=A0A1I8JPT3_9PLAT
MSSHPIRRQQVSVRPRPRSAIRAAAQNQRRRPAAEKSKGKVLEATVIATGPGRLCETSGQPLPVSVKVGDKVLLPEFGGIKHHGLWRSDTPVPLRRLLLAAQSKASAATSTTSGAAKLDSLKSLGLTDKLNFVNGERCDGNGAAFDNVYPASGHKTAAVRESTASDIDKAVLASKERSLKLGEAPPALIRARLQHLAAVEVLDTGKPIWEASADIEAWRDTLQMFSGLAHTLAGEHVHLPGGSFYYTRREPFGESALASAPGIIRFSCTFVMAGGPRRWPCGNPRQPWPAATAWCSSPPRSPRWAPCSWPRSTPEAGLPAGLFSVVQGGPDTGRALVRHPDIAKVSFTRRSGWRTGGGRGCRPVDPASDAGVLGKSPLIIFADADLDEAVRGAVLANYLCQGQVCSNAARVFVERRILDDFVDRLLRAVAGLRVGDPMLTETAIGASISSQHAERVLGYIGSAEAEGAKRLFGGDRVETGHFLRPCVLANCSDGMRAVREEIFGAVLTPAGVRHREAEAVARANATEFGLSGAACSPGTWPGPTGSSARQCRGSLYINTYNSYPPRGAVRRLQDVAASAGRIARSRCGPTRRSSLSMWSAPASSCLPCPRADLVIFGAAGAAAEQRTSRKTRVPPLLHRAEPPWERSGSPYCRRWLVNLPWAPFPASAAAQFHNTNFDAFAATTSRLHSREK